MSEPAGREKKTWCDGPFCLSATRALCNTCGRLCDAQIRLENGRIILAKWCPEHGITQALVSASKTWFLQSLSYVKPGTRPLSRAVSGSKPACPDACGLCPSHQQHTCVPIIEITNRCNLECPICLVSGRVGGELAVNEVEFILEKLLQYEAKINMLTLSGGEPTVHPEFKRILRICQRPEIGLVSVSTNGLALEENPDLVKAIRDHDAVISLQFDGVAEPTYRALRGRGDLAGIKQRVLDRILKAGARLSLTVTLGRGINEQELPQILDLFFSHDNVLSLMFHRLNHRTDTRKALDILTIPDVIRLVVEASGGRLRMEDFNPLPCSHPSCFALAYLLKLDNGDMVSLSSLIGADAYLDILKNQALFGADIDTLERIKDALYGIWSAQNAIPQREAILARVRSILQDISSLGGEDHHRAVIGLGAKSVKSIFIHDFMDRATFDLSRAIKCCNHYCLPDGRLIPACMRNNMGSFSS